MSSAPERRLQDVEIERQQAEALAQREQLFSDTMIESMPGIVYFYDEHGRFLRWNRNFLTVSGYSAEEIGRMHPLDFFRGEERERVQQRIGEVFAGGASFVEASFVAKDGTATPYFFTGRRVVFNGGPCLVGMGIDITERKRAEVGLAASERRLRDMLENIALIALTLDTRGVVTFCNDHLLRVTGWKREEIMGANWFERFVPKSDPVTPRLFFNTVQSGKFPQHYDNPILTKAGEEREIAWNNTVLRDNAGTIVGTASIGEDVTDRRRAERELLASEERFRQVVENIDEVFWMADVATQQMLYISPRYETICGRSCASLLASRQAWLEGIHEADRERVAAAEAKQAEGGYDQTFRVVRPDGSIRWVRARAFPIKDERGVVHRIVGVADDITENKQLQEQFLRAQRLESIGMLAAGIAHDLNNVLAPIGLAAPMLRASAATAGERRMLDTVSNCVARGAGLVRQILGFAHGIGGEPRLVQVKHLLRDIAAVTETFPKSITIKEEVAKDLWPVMGNPTQIHQILLNFCVNARDAMPEGGTLFLGAENCVLDDAAGRALDAPGAKPGAWLVLQVRDTGTGIPPEVVERMWEPFFTTKAPDKGTGLGLSTVRGIVESHGGFIALQTKPGQGTTFRVYLPAAETPAMAGTNSGLPIAGRGQGEIILVVDDDEAMRSSICEVLSTAGYQPLAAVNGADAAGVFAARPGDFALVITDLDMPLLGGAGLCDILRKARPELKILAISGSSSANRSVDPAPFATGFMPKPFAAETLLHYVQRLLRDEAIPTHSLTPWR